MVLEAFSSRARFICTTVAQIGVADEVPVLHTPVEVAKARFSMTCSFVDGFVVFDGFI